MYIKFMNYFDALYYVNKAGHIDCVNPRKGKIIDEIMITRGYKLGWGWGSNFVSKQREKNLKLMGMFYIKTMVVLAT